MVVVGTKGNVGRTMAEEKRKCVSFTVSTCINSRYQEYIEKRELYMNKYTRVNVNF